jgi:hypothetical protein
VIKKKKDEVWNSRLGVTGWFGIPGLGSKIEPLPARAHLFLRDDVWDFI